MSAQRVGVLALADVQYPPAPRHKSLELMQQLGGAGAFGAPLAFVELIITPPNAASPGNTPAVNDECLEQGTQAEYAFTQ
ncbi:hypothetical protein CTheo_1606 [Ceratobasidium theobromae]|uniref:Uncharacterized protein n=1 Tax=Ceratobasidium theobromae TaxID=1582974 RepID=A0A5N5QTT9_9AGAM|nr:hypothetical protein CTheo_1606 [Ceratobasidium theobromae]